MNVNLSIKGVPAALAESLRARAERNHRSLQGELMAIIEAAAFSSAVVAAESTPAPYRAAHVDRVADELLAGLDADLGTHALAGGPWLSREAAHERTALRIAPNPAPNPAPNHAAKAKRGAKRVRQ